MTPRILHIEISTLEPDIRLADNYGFDAPTLREPAEVIEQKRHLIERTWHEHFG